MAHELAATKSLTDKHVDSVLSAEQACSGARAAGVLFSGGTIVAFDEASESLRVVRGGSLLVKEDKIAGVFEAAVTPSLPPDTETVNATGKIITPGFIDTHRHGWQTQLKTLGSNTTLPDYFVKFGEFVGGSVFTADDVYIGQLTGLYEALNAGVTTTLDHAHSTWSNETAAAGLKASIDSGARVFYAYALHNVSGLVTMAEQLPHLESLLEEAPFKGTPTSLGIAYDFWSSSDTPAVIDLIQRQNVSFVTVHYLGGPWNTGSINSPEDLDARGVLNSTAAFVFSHSSFITPAGAIVLRQNNQYAAITPESEMHYGHTDPNSHLITDQAALGVDTHFTFSTDILTQARIWLQAARYRIYALVLDTWRLPKANPMSATQAFMLATRNGGLALRRPDLGVIKEGAKADVVLWDGEAPNMLGWVDPVAAVILHAHVGNVEAVLVDGKWKKRDGKIVDEGYAEVRERFLRSAERIHQVYREMPPVDLGDSFLGTPFGDVLTVDTQRGEGNGYGELFV
ncbi:5-methylthioadenosine/S-adenosylhomocysteine deaminase [Mycena kentingensis (nom. inval.)]|nr:5-methylthioadenosine/S-adenosylhomocysteine deaminase [Mycena kentingensis (nom. inval.)]